MRRTLLVLIAAFFYFGASAQRISPKDFVIAASLPEKKFDNFFEKYFSSAGTRIKGDTIINVYQLKIDKKKRVGDPVMRTLETYRAGDYFAFSFFTNSRSEYDNLKSVFYKDGFFCGADNDTNSTALFQKRAISVLVKRKEDDDTMYSFLFHKESLPASEKIQNAEDLFQFNSHEYLLAVFGESNVIKDVYYLADKSMVPCSVIFPRTSRQAIFFWKDELNLCNPTTIMIGGNMNNVSSASYDGLIQENSWLSRDGIYSGMNLFSLVKLNGNTFNFYGKNSSSPFLVLPENKGALDFRNNTVILGCLNPTGSTELEKAIVDVGNILQDNLGLYVFMMILYPPTVSKAQRDLSKNSW